jgi:hypothetical protein
MEQEIVLWGVVQTARVLGIDGKTLRKELEAKRIPGLRVGRCWKIPLWWIRQQRDGSPQMEK